MSNENEGNTVSGEILRQITPKVIGGKIRDFEPGETYIPICRIYGTANGVKRGQGTYGPYAKLIGSFEGVSIETGEIYTAPTLILPPPMNETLAAAIESGDTGLQFAFEVGVKPGVNRTGKSKAVYEWVTKNLIKQSAADPLAELRNAVKALPAPTVETAKAGKGK